MDTEDRVEPFAAVECIKAAVNACALHGDSSPEAILGLATKFLRLCGLPVLPENGAGQPG